MARGGSLVHLVYLVILVYLVSLVSLDWLNERDKTDRAPDRLLLSHPPLTQRWTRQARKSRMSWFRQCVGKQDARSSLHRSFGTSCLRERRSLWRIVGLRTQTAMALDHRSTRMDIGDLFSYSRQDDLGSQTCSYLCIFDGLRRSRDESHLSSSISGWFVLRDPTTNRLRKPVRGAWRGSGSSSLSGLSGLFGFAQQERQDKPNKQDRLPWPRRSSRVVRET